MLWRAHSGVEREPPAIDPRSGAETLAPANPPGRVGGRRCGYHRGMLRGRDRERALIREILDDARHSRSRALVLHGEPGIGKSALLDAALCDATGMTVLRAHGVASEAQMPFAAADRLVRPLLRHMGALPPPQADALRFALGLAGGAGGSRFLVSLAVLSLLSDEAEEAPVLCLVDDAHWLDEASADVVAFVARRLGAEGIALLVASREAGAFEPGIPAHRVRGLDAAAAAALLDDHAPAPLPPEVRTRLLAGAHGNPLALLELPRALSGDELTGAEPLSEPLPVNARLEDAFLARSHRLPQPTQMLLVVAAADDGQDLATVLRAARELGIDPGALDAAEEAGLVSIRGHTVTFRHSLTRSAIYHGAPTSRRRAAHDALAAVHLDERDRDRRAWHRAASVIEPNADISSELEDTAERARQRGGLAAASRAYERAAELSPSGPSRGRLLLAAAHDAWFAGRLERTRLLVDRAAPMITTPQQRADLARWRGLLELTHGAPVDAAGGLMEAAEEVAGVDDDRALYLLSIASIAASYAKLDDRARAIAALAAAMGPTKAPYTEMKESLLGLGAHTAGDFVTAAGHLRRSLSLSRRSAPAFELQPELEILSGRAALFLGDDAAADELHRRVASRLRRDGALGVLTQALTRLGQSEVWAGRWSSAAALAEESVGLARTIGQHALQAHGLALGALVAALQGDEGRCLGLLAESEMEGRGRRLMHVAELGGWAQTVLALGQARTEEALQSARAVSGTLVRLWAGIDRVEAAARGGDRAAARAWLDELTRWAVAGGAPWARAIARHGDGLVAADPVDAEPAFADAIEAHQGADRPFELARARLALGELLRRGRRRVEARENLRAALDGFERLGSTAWAERARIELRASGETAARGDASSREHLTPQEVQIAQFVATGLTNRDVAAQLFLSPRTIDFHLRNVFRKLGVSSRTQLANIELGGSGPRR